MGRFLFLLLFLCCLSHEVRADYFVSRNGDDSSSGEKTAPFATIERAIKAARRKKGDIVLQPGHFSIQHTLDLSQADDSVTIRAAESGKTTLEAGRHFSLDLFHPLSKDESELVRPEFRSGIVALDLAQNGIELIPRWKDVFPDGPTGLFSIYSGGKRLPLSRYPNQGFLKMARVFREGDTRTGEAGVFAFDDSRHLQWENAIKRKGLWFKGFWRIPWQSEYVRIESIDINQKKVHMAAPVSGGIGSKYHRPQGSGEEPYFAVNLPEEIDQAGEWAVDFEKKKLYLLPSSEIRKNGIVIADSAEPLLRITNAKNIIIKGLRLESSLGNGIEIQGGERCTVSHCFFHNIGEAGIVIDGGKNHKVTYCEIRETGAQGVRVTGGDRKSLTPCGHEVSHNHIHHFARIKTIYAGGVHLDAVGAVVRHNLIHDTPHVGIHYQGNDNIFEYNELYHIAQVSNDMGAFYTWGDWTSRGNIIRFNLVHSSPQADGVYCDDGDSGDRIENNLFIGLHSGVLIGGGRDNQVIGNIAFDCKKGFHLDDRGTSRGYNLENRRMVNAVTEVNHQAFPWSEKYPEMTNLFDFHPELPVGNLFSDNLAFNCQTPFSWRAEHENFKHSQFENNEERSTSINEGQLLRSIQNRLIKPLRGEIPLQKIGR